MAQDNSRPDVAVFIDFENVYVSVRDKLDANPNFESIMDRCSELGRVVISRAYADWYRYPRVTSALYANGVEPMYVPTYYYDKDMGRTGRAIKNSADMNMCIDAMKTLFTNPNIAKFVLVTGDRDFIPLVNMIRQQGKDVIIIGIGGAASTHLAQSADEFIFYEQLIGKTTNATLREAARDRDRQRAAERIRAAAEAEVEPTPAPAPAPPAPAPEPTSELDPFDTLVEAVHLARKRGYVCTLGSLKLVMKELMGGEFRESRYKDVSGKPFLKFKDFVQDAERRGKVQIFTSGTINEVFLPGEDPYKLSQFAGDLKEEPPELKAEPPAATNGRQPARAAAAERTPEQASAPTGRSRRRRRSRGGRQSGQAAPLDVAATNGEEIEELSEINGDVEELAALAADDLFDPGVGDEELTGEDPLLIPDELLALPTEDELDEEEIPDLDRLEPFDDEDELDEARSPYGVDEVSLLAQAEAADEAAAALIAEMTGEGRETDSSQGLFDFGDVEEQLAVEEPSAQTLPFLTVPDLPDFAPEEDSTQQPSEAAAEEPAVEEEQPAQQPSEAAAEEPAVEEEQPAQQPSEAVAEEATATEEQPAEQPSEAVAEAATAVEQQPAEQPSEAPAEETPVAEAAPAPAAEAATEETPAEPVAEPITFSDEEWQLFREMMARFPKPVPFAQIFDSLRVLRQEQKLNRTNEQLRTLAKQAINSGMLERSGRGTRVYYRLPQASEE